MKTAKEFICDRQLRAPGRQQSTPAAIALSHPPFANGRGTEPFRQRCCVGARLPNDPPSTQLEVPCHPHDSSFPRVPHNHGKRGSESEVKESVYALSAQKLEHHSIHLPNSSQCNGPISQRVANYISFHQDSNVYDLELFDISALENPSHSIHGKHIADNMTSILLLRTQNNK